VTARLPKRGKAALDTGHERRYRTVMAQSILIFDFGTNEEAAQQARHKIESWQQGLRLGKKVLFKFERGEAVEESGEAAKPEGGAAAEESSSKAKTKTGKKKAAKEGGGEGANGEATARIRLLIRLGFSDHEKLIQQRVLDRFAAEEPFKSAQGETIRQGNPAFAESADLFDSLD
jgi:hypothetical protein